VIWIRFANSHTGSQLIIAASEAGQMAASDYGLITHQKSLALMGASTDDEE
jgi:hypothetical protein